MKMAFILCLCACFACMGYYLGKNDGLYQGAIDMRVCMDNGAVDWYVSGTELNCIFDQCVDKLKKNGVK